jgi:hypothetical protein
MPVRSFVLRIAVVTSLSLLSDDDPRERQRWLASQLPSSAGNARAVRLFGTQLLTVRIDLDS